ncbi:hypothetical protein HD806DRAFT_516144 [Xylariaceae sp. AK1471]|nr:hypothetical protein HD806DRAFT_516144 [Xylariaceae sp. AK1471]
MDALNSLTGPPAPEEAPVRRQSRSRIEEALKRFQDHIIPDDRKLFYSTDLEGVWRAVRAIEHEQSVRKSLRNSRRIEPLFDALKIFGNAIEPLCQGVPFMCFAWAPIKLMLVIFDGHLTAYERIIEAYSQIAQHLPRFDRLSHAFRDQPEFQDILADVYTDILYFHTEVYKIARRGGWKRLFDASWKDFRAQFDGILTNMARNRDLVDREAASFEILEAKVSRQELISRLEKRDKESRDWHLREVFVWLDLAGRDREQEDLLSKFQTNRHEDTCQWVVEHPKIHTWLDEEDPRTVLWLRGKPGSGKTTIASYIEEIVPMSQSSLLVCCLCSDLLREGTQNVVSVLLRLICTKILRHKNDLLSFVYEEYVKFNKAASIKRVRELLEQIFESLGTTFIIVDGLDEYDTSDQTAIVDELSRLLKVNSDKTSRQERPKLKVMICSRETHTLLKHIRKKLKNITKISLSDEADSVSKDIAKFTKASLVALDDRFEEEDLEKVGTEIAKKADGMFLWVKLVLALAEDQWSLASLRDTINRLPQGLDGIYGAILNRLQAYPDETQQIRARRILGFLACALRPLKCQELCDGLVFLDDDGVLNEETKLGKGALDICKPLIEERAGGQASLVHFTARSYLLNKASGPYLSETQVQSDFARACVKYLHTSTIFLSEIDSRRAAAEIVKGYHNLFPYAQEFWIEHLTSFLWRAEAEAQSEHRLKISDLLHKFQRDTDSPTVHHLGVDSPSSSPGTTQHQTTPKIASNKASVFDKFPEVVHNYVLFTNSMANQAQKDCRTLDADEDPTRLTEAYLQYRSVLESLLDGTFLHDSTCEITLQDIEEFRSRSQAGLYICHWVGCIRSWTGFDSAEEREQHEASHKQRYRCRESGCGISFTSRQNFRRHVFEYHIKEKDIILKRKARPTEDTEGEQQHYMRIPPSGSEAPDYLSHWYSGSNIDFIKQEASLLALQSSKSVLEGILERMSDALKEKLKQEEIEPLSYHFRKSAVKEFRAKQDEVLQRENQSVRRKLLVKNTVFHARLEEEASVSIDACLGKIIDIIITRSQPEQTETNDPNVDVSHFWSLPKIVAS